jgi:ribosome recycling factor
MDISEGQKKLQKVISRLEDDLAKIRTGRASSDMVENVKVEVYDSKMPIEHMATISIPDARTIVIKPWDKDNVESIEKALLKSDVGLTPVVDGNIVRLTIPSLTKERRKEFVKDMKDRVEQAKIAVRSVRHEMMDGVEEMGEGGGVSEDFIRRKKDEVEEKVSEAIDEIEDIGDKKEEELMTI